MKKATKLAAFALIATMLLSGVACSSKEAARSADDAGYHNKSITAGAYEDVSGDVNSYLGDAEWGTSETADVSYENYEESTANTPTTTGPSIPTGTMLIRRVTMDVETTGYDSVNTTIASKVKELGGYIESSNSRGTGKNGDLRSTSFVIRVPIDNLDEMINAVGNACTVLSSSENTEDVTLQYSDIQAHIESLRVEQQTLLNLLAQADSLEAVITLQSRLTEVRYEIESYESRAKVLQNQSTYSTLSLNVREVLVETEQVETKKLTFGEEILEGLKESLEDIREDGKDFIIGFVSALPYLLIFAIFVVIIVFIIKAIIKSAKKKAAKKAEAKKAAPAATTAPAPAPEAKAEEKKE